MSEKEICGERIMELGLNENYMKIIRGIGGFEAKAK